jgi:hypothetical protein
LDDLNTALSFKIAYEIPKYSYFIGDIPPLYPRKIKPQKVCFG